jgi:hypothetical protein
MIRKVVIGAAVGSLLLVACGSGGGNGASSAKGKQYVDALVKDKSSNGLTSELTTTQARCFAGKIVDAVGVDTLEKAGITPANVASAKGLDALSGKVTKDQANKVVDALLSNTCFDFGAVIRKQTPSLAKLSTDKVDCLFKNLFDLPAARAELANLLITGKDPNFDKAFGGTSELFTILGKCKISEQELQAT